MTGHDRAATRVWRFGRCAGVLILAVVLSGLATVGRPAPAQAEPLSMVYFDVTGQTLGGAFLSRWLNEGGMNQLGAPVSQVVRRGDTWVQWFQYGRLELNTPTVEEASAEDVNFVWIGLALADELGYSRNHPAFQPVPDQGWTDQRYFPETGHTLGNAFLQSWETGQTARRLGVPISQEFSIGSTVYQYFQRGALSWEPNYGVNLVPLGALDAGLRGQLRLTGSQPEGVPSYGERVLMNLPGLQGERWIDINLSTYTLTAYVGNTPVMTTVLVDGAPATPTVRGTFAIYWKLPSQTMRGFNTDGSEYVTEDVPWVMYFYADFAIHGAYWRYSFGYSASHGCVNLPVADAAALYAWAYEGMRVEVHD
ncbi:MAG: hypothetical protein DCC58_16440 [Chloroflexi bacterium]|nr:MAG: hypothetical protein DCC58_16440 [Chloroflexota bacterium]